MGVLDVVRVETMPIPQYVRSRNGRKALKLSSDSKIFTRVNATQRRTMF